MSLQLSICLSVCLSVCPHSHSLISRSISAKSGTEVTTPKSKNEFVGGQHRITLPLFCPQTPNFGAWTGVFKPTWQNIKTCILSKLPHRFQPKFFSDKYHQMNYMSGPNMRIKNPRWRTAAILEKNRKKSPYLRYGWTDRHKIWRSGAMWPFWPFVEFVCLSVLTLTVALIDFRQKWQRSNNPQK